MKAVWLLVKTTRELSLRNPKKLNSFLNLFGFSPKTVLFLQRANSNPTEFSVCDACKFERLNLSLSALEKAVCHEVS